MIFIEKIDRVGKYLPNKVMKSISVAILGISGVTLISLGYFFALTHLSASPKPEASGSLGVSLPPLWLFIQNFFQAAAVLFAIAVALWGADYLGKSPQIRVEVNTTDLEVNNIWIGGNKAVCEKIRKEKNRDPENVDWVTFPINYRYKTGPAKSTKAGWHRLSPNYSRSEFESFVRQDDYPNLLAYIDPAYSIHYIELEEDPYGDSKQWPASDGNYINRITLYNEGRNPRQNVRLMVPGWVIKELAEPWGAIVQPGRSSSIQIPLLPESPNGRTFIVKSDFEPIYKEEVLVEAAAQREVSQELVKRSIWITIILSTLWAAISLLAPKNF